MSSNPLPANAAAAGPVTGTGPAADASPATDAGPVTETGPGSDAGRPDGRDWFERWLDAHRADVISWRRHIHQNPELAREEYQTTAFVVAQLRAAGLDPQVLPLGTGLYCDVGPADADGKRLGLRADMDALPMTEETGLPFASTVAGAAHSCGHDAHTTILMAAGIALASAPRLQAGVRLIFQPAEEVMPGGALDVIDADVMAGVNRIFALHCDPHLEVGTIGLRVGPITSAADVVELALNSPGGHTSRPYLTADLVHAMGLLITGVPGMLSRRVDVRSRTVMAWGAAHAGNAPNAIPQTGMLRGTVRTGEHATWQLLEPLVTEIVEGILAPTGVTVDIHYQRGVPPVDNDEHSVALLRRAVEAIGPDVVVPTPQSSGGEDFAWYLEHVPGAMARLGVWSGEGRRADIHQPDFDIDERALEIGLRAMVNLVAPPLRSPNLPDPGNPPPAAR